MARVNLYVKHFTCPVCGTKKEYSCNEDEWGWRYAGVKFCSYSCFRKHTIPKGVKVYSVR